MSSVLSGMLVGTLSPSLEWRKDGSLCDSAEVAVRVAAAGCQDDLDVQPAQHRQPRREGLCTELDDTSRLPVQLSSERIGDVASLDVTPPGGMVQCCPASSMYGTDGSYFASLTHTHSTPVFPLWRNEWQPSMSPSSRGPTLERQIPDSAAGTLHKKTRQHTQHQPSEPRDRVTTTQATVTPRKHSATALQPYTSGRRRTPAWLARWVQARTAAGYQAAQTIKPKPGGH